MTSYADERPIPKSTQPSPGPSVNYTLGLVADVNGNLEPAFVGVVPNQKPGDGPLDIRIMEDCTIVITVDTSVYNWELKHKHSITLGLNSVYPGDRYFNLKETFDANGHCTGISFDAYYLDADVANLDPYNLSFLAYLQSLGGAGAAAAATAPLKVRIDPDIRNPGDSGG